MPAEELGAHELERAVSATPPRGWNSYDYYDSRITEAEFRACVAKLAVELLPHGYEYAVIDYLWADPLAQGWTRPDGSYGKADVALDESGRPVERLAMDRYGRLLPAVERFPSAAGGRGFKPLADYVHSLGMKFGIHIMRGVPRQAYYDGTPVLGAEATARSIGEADDTCAWCNHMFGIDDRLPGAQAYYDSLFELYASWGVDLVKADDLMWPVYDAEEVRMIRRALAKCGRPMVLSLSPGEAPLGRAAHVAENAHLWRVSIDFWDRWDHLRRAFGLMDAWTPHRGPGRWPDADMLPLGRLSRGGRPEGPERVSRYTPDEHRTLMTLWCIARSPLIWGGDPLTSDPAVYEVLSNEEVLAVNSDGRDARQSFRIDDTVGWIARDAPSDDRFLALFNLADDARHVGLNLRSEGLRGVYAVRDLWAGAERGRISGWLGADLPPHGSALYRVRPSR